MIKVHTLQIDLSISQERKNKSPIDASLHYIYDTQMDTVKQTIKSSVNHGQSNPLEVIVHTQTSVIRLDNKNQLENEASNRNDWVWIGLIQIHTIKKPFFPQFNVQDLNKLAQCSPHRHKILISI